MTELRLVCEQPRFADECLDRIAKLPSVKTLTIEVRSVDDRVMKKLGAFNHLTSLTLTTQTLSAVQVQHLHTLKGLKSLHLSAVTFPPKTLEGLKVALPQTDIDLGRAVSFRFYEPLTIAVNEDALAKLQKEKFNAAIAGIIVHSQLVSSCRGQRGYSQFVELTIHLKAASAELNDPAMMMKVARDYLQLMEVAKTEWEALDKAGAADPIEYQLVRARYFDAQIYLLKLQKKLEKK